MPASGNERTSPAPAAMIRRNDAYTQTMNSCWVLTDGAVGMENQGLAVAEALGLPIRVKRVQTRRPWKWLPRQLRCGPLRRLQPGGDPLRPPWPRLLLTCGRQSAPLSIAIRGLSEGRTFTVHIQNPKTAFKHFDLVAVPRHDGVSGANVVLTLGAPHRVTRDKLANPLAAPLLRRHSDLPRPWLAVLLGGKSKAFRFTEARAGALAARLRQLAEDAGGSLLLTPSRRTPAGVIDILRQALAGLPQVFWDGRGDNPYFAFLGAADYLIVTGDSVNMVTEAAGTGKPVYVFQLEGRSARFDRFHAGMQRHGAARPLGEALEQWAYEPVNDTEKIAAKIRQALGLANPAPV